MKLVCLRHNLPALQNLTPTHVLVDETYMEHIECQLTTRPKADVQVILPVTAGARAGGTNVPEVDTTATPTQVRM